MIFFRSHILQADSEEMYQIWIEALQKAIGNAIQTVQGTSDQSGSTDNQNSCFRAVENSHLSRVDNKNKSQKKK